MEQYQIDSNGFIDIGGANVIVQNNNTYITKIPVPAMYDDTILRRNMVEINYNPTYINFLCISMHKRDGTLSVNYLTEERDEILEQELLKRCEMCNFC